MQRRKNECHDDCISCPNFKMVTYKGNCIWLCVVKHKEVLNVNNDNA
jgi:hypothetical protein